MSAITKEGKEVKDKDPDVGSPSFRAALSSRNEELLRDSSRDASLPGHFIGSELRPDLNGIAVRR